MVRDEYKKRHCPSPFSNLASEPGRIGIQEDKPDSILDCDNPLSRCCIQNAAKAESELKKKSTEGDSNPRIIALQAIASRLTDAFVSVISRLATRAMQSV